MGNQEACVDFKKRFQENPQDVCVCVFKCVDMGVYRVVFCGRRRNKAWDTDPHDGLECFTDTC